MLIKVTNLLPTSVTVEDLGLVLPARGFQTVRAEEWARSVSGAELEVKRWVRADKQYVPGPRPSVPSQRPRSPVPATTPAVAVPAEPLSESGIDTPRVSGAYVSQEAFDRHTKNQEEIMKMLSSLMGAVPAGLDQIHKTIERMPAPAVVPFRPGMVQSHEVSRTARGDDPMFIPSKIVPDDAKAAIKVQEGEASTNVDSAVEALKKARGRKP